MQPRIKILIATDGTHGAKAAVADGLLLARRLDAEVLFVAVEHAQPAPFGVPPYYVADLDTRRFAVEALEAAAAEANEVGVEAHGRVLAPTMDPAHAIVEEAREADADLIVVGSRGRGAVVGALLGSVSRSIVCHADRPVLVAKEYGSSPKQEAAIREHFFVNGGV
jgi:nucleotide-binding universal stress UspA family protein